MNEKLILSAVQEAYRLYINMAQRNIIDIDSKTDDDISMFIFYLNLELKAIHPIYLEDLHTIVAQQIDAFKLKNKSIHTLTLMRDELEKDKFLADLAYHISQKKPIAFTKKGSNDNEFGPSVGTPMSRSVPETNHNNTWLIIISFFAVVIVLYLITVWN